MHGEVLPVNITVECIKNIEMTLAGSKIHDNRCKQNINNNPGTLHVRVESVLDESRVT